MLQITPQMKILVAVEPADFRRGIDGLERQRRRAKASSPETRGLESTLTDQFRPTHPDVIGKATVKHVQYQMSIALSRTFQGQFALAKY